MQDTGHGYKYKLLLTGHPHLFLPPGQVPTRRSLFKNARSPIHTRDALGEELTQRGGTAGFAGVLGYLVKEFRSPRKSEYYLDENLKTMHLAVES